jgi:hypothetical protein
MAQISTGSSTAGKANVDANFNINVVTPQAEEQAGFAQMSSEVDAGDVMGARTVRAVEVSHDYRVRVGSDQPLFNLSFEGTIIAQAHLQQPTATLTIAQSSGFLILNSGAATTANNAAIVRTYRCFPLLGSYPTYCDLWLREANPTATNAVSEWGFGYVATNAAPTDGIFFRRLSGGQLQAVINFAGTELTSNITTTNVPSRDGAGSYDANETNHFLISNHNDDVEFWINDTMVARISTPSVQGGPASSQQQPVFARVYNGATAASAGRSVQLGFVQVAGGDVVTNKPWAHQMVGSGGGGYQNQPGVASGQTASYANNAAPASATLSNTAAGYTTLGGQWQAAAVVGAETDYALFGYQVPVGTNALPGKTLYITDVRIGETAVTGAAVATSTLFQWALGVGSTAVGLNTTDAAATVGPRRVTLGTQALAAAAAIGAISSGFQMNFSTPLAAPPGTFVHVILKIPSGAATASLVFRGTVMVNGYFE